jgi:hypothetical protein
MNDKQVINEISYLMLSVTRSALGGTYNSWSCRIHAVRMNATDDAAGSHVAQKGEWELQEAADPIPDDMLVKDTVSDAFRCAVCLELMLEPVSLVPCGHAFCRGCSDKLMEGAKETGGVRCPKDRVVGVRSKCNPIHDTCTCTECCTTSPPSTQRRLCNATFRLPS